MHDHMCMRMHDRASRFQVSSFPVEKARPCEGMHEREILTVSKFGALKLMHDRARVDTRPCKLPKINFLLILRLARSCKLTCTIVRPDFLKISYFGSHFRARNFRRRKLFSLKLFLIQRPKNIFRSFSLLL